MKINASYLAISLASAAMAVATDASAAPVNWIDWTAGSVGSGGSATGTITSGAASTNVAFTGQLNFIQTGTGTNYFSPSAPYVSPQVDNAPPAAEMLSLSVASNNRLTFSRPVEDLFMAVVSLNANAYRFNRDFELVSTGTGFFGSGSMTRTDNGDGTYTLGGSGETHGVIRFRGTVSDLQWTSGTENWNGITIGVYSIVQCGDGIRSLTETCDDGNTTSGDGCSAACAVEPGYTCDDPAFFSTGLAPDRSVLPLGERDPHWAWALGAGAPAPAVRYTNAAYFRPTLSGFVSTSGTGGGAAGTYTFTQNVVMPASLAGNVGFNIRLACDNNCELFVNGTSFASRTGSVSSNFTAIVYFTVPASAFVAGNNEVRVEVQDTGPPLGLLLEARSSDIAFDRSPDVCVARCGDGVRVMTEACDDANNASGDGCSATCTVEPGYSCADPATPPEAADVCTAGCGNGVLFTGEGCDDGNTTDGDGCSATCGLEDGRACNTNPAGALGDASCASGVCDTVGNAAPGVCEPAASCGNGVLEANEGCDDGANTGGDGCGATCLVEDGSRCNTASPGALGSASCASGVCDAIGNPVPGVCEPALACGNGALDADEGCDDGNRTNGDGCTSSCRVELGSACNATMPGLLGSLSCDSGRCDTVGNRAPGVCETATGCGNGLLEATEGCDDGNTTDGDGCSAACLIDTGNSCSVDANGLTGNASCASAVCDATGGAPGTCEEADVCGNGVLDADEGCDDGNTASGDGCNAICQIENGSACNANMIGLVGNASCASGVCNTAGGAPGVCQGADSCGNGAREAGEGCDDGNTTAGDGCDANCKLENGQACNVAMPGSVGNASCASNICDVSGGAPGTCEAVNSCGNGVLEAMEGCDDGNTTAGDGCDVACKIELGGACNATAPGLMGNASCASDVCNTSGGAPGVCAPPLGCGNNVLEAAEGCDDGNNVAGDGCNALCLIENGGACSGLGGLGCESGICDTTGNAAPGVCEAANVCGNGVQEGTEACDDGNTVGGDMCPADCAAVVTGCSDAMPCGEGEFCSDMMVCQPQLPPGGVCTADAQCVSDNCVDNVCSNDYKYGVSGGGCSSSGTPASLLLLGVVAMCLPRRRRR